MQRSNYGNPPPATSPPLHHPVPQHVSTVPQLRSPPPPVTQQQHQSGYGNPYQPQAPPGAANAFGAYGGLMTDPTAQMGFQVGQTALKHGTEYVEQNVSSLGTRDLLEKY
jgi:protein transport protein YIF1